MYYFVHSDCSGVGLCTNWCTRTALVLVCVLFGAHCKLRTRKCFIGRPLSKRLMNARQLIQNESSLCYPVSSSLLPNKKELPRVSIKQSTHAACTRIVWLLYRMCTLNALVFAYVLLCALGLLWCWPVYYSITLTALVFACVLFHAL